MLKRRKKYAGKWQKLIAKMPPESSKFFKPSKLRTDMLSFYRAAKNMLRFPRMENEGTGVRVCLDDPDKKLEACK